MKRHTPESFARAIAPDRLARAVERGLRRIAPAVRRSVAGDAVARRMRDAGSEPVRRAEGDDGPLRITSRPASTGPVRYAAAVRGGVAGAIDRVTQTAPLRITYAMGVDTDVVPQGLNELPPKPGSTRTAPARPTFTASIKAKARELRRLARKMFTGAVREVVQ